jgi:hypothetical protein
MLGTEIQILRKLSGQRCWARAVTVIAPRQHSSISADSVPPENGPEKILDDYYCEQLML